MSKIALVDDDRNILTSVSMTLEAEGFEVETYNDGQQALDAFNKKLPDMAVLDIKMPRMDGMDLLQRLRQLWNNLIDNTCAYTQAPGRLKVSLRREADDWVLRWEDSAPGVPVNELPRLTERLYRVEGSRNRETGGTGLGLAIARTVILRHGGEIALANRPEGGLAVTITLPPAG